jgi:hypothetical protein
VTQWRKSTFSSQDGDCVQAADLGDGIGVRDSKDPDGSVLHFTRAEMRAWVMGCKAGEFDDLCL